MMPRKGEEISVDPELRARALADYQSGAGLRTVARRYRLADATLRRELEAAGIPVRTRAEQNRLEALRQHDSPLWQVTADRWQELYWGPERPSLGTLAAWASELAGHPVSVPHLREVLVHHGIAIRSPAEQLRVDGEMGRRSQYGNYDFHALPPERQDDVRRKLSAAFAGRRKTRAHARKSGLAHRKRETRLCAWCAAPTTRRPSEFHQPPENTCCSRPHATFLRNWRSRHPNLPRPLILERLRELLGADPPTLDRLEKLAEQCGAREVEIDALLFG